MGSKIKSLDASMAEPLRLREKVKKENWSWRHFQQCHSSRTVQNCFETPFSRFLGQTDFKTDVTTLYRKTVKFNVLY